MKILLQFARRVLGGAALALAFQALATAQTLPDAGALQRQIEREQPTFEPKPSTGIPNTAPASKAAPGGPVVRIKAFTFQGNTLISTDELQAVVAPWVGRDVDLSGLEAAAAAVGNAYRARDWVVRTLIPRQDVTEGVVRIDVVEGRLGRVYVDSDSTARMPMATVQSFVDASVATGSLLNMRDLDRGLMLADDLPGVSVTGRMLPGANPGETDIALHAVREPLLTGVVSVDNYGANSVGTLRESAALGVASPLGIGDFLSATFIHTEGSNYARGEYSIPVGAQGLRLGVFGSAFRYRLTSDPFSSLDARGSSVSGGIQAYYPIVRSQNFNLYGNASWEHRSFRNQALGRYISNYGVDDLTLSVNGSFFDELAGGGANSFSLAVISSRADLSGSPNEAADAAGPNVAGRSSKLRLSLSRQQRLTNSTSLFAGFTSQWSDRNQDSSEKFYLGGPFGVRAYPINEGAGSNGMLLNLELRQQLMHNLTATAFYDWGRVTDNVNNNFAGAASVNRYSLQGAGLGLTWQHQSGLTLRATWAHRIGSNPNPTATGQDQDGTLHKNRFWLNASMAF